VIIVTRNIQVIRDQMNLSTKQLAALVGVSERAVARWIEGTREVPEPVWRLLEIWQTAKPETVEAALKNGYAIEIRPPSADEMAQRMSPHISVFRLPG
jgi:transcriptional regulator with XRE-family HTH domain